MEMRREQYEDVDCHFEDSWTNQRSESELRLNLVVAQMNADEDLIRFNKIISATLICKQ